MSVKEFSKFLKRVKYPKNDPTWDVKGVLGNNEYRFDVRSLDNPQKFTTASRADKLALEMPDKWVIVDTEELHKYIIKNKITYFNIEDLTSSLEWTIFIDKIRV